MEFIDFIVVYFNDSDDCEDIGEIFLFFFIEVLEDEIGEFVVIKFKRRSGVFDSECVVCMILFV